MTYPGHHQSGPHTYPPQHGNYPPQHGSYPPPGWVPPQPPKKRKWPWIVGGAVGFIVLLATVSPSQPAPSTPTVAAPSVAAPSIPTVQQAPAAVEEPAAPAAPAGPVTSFEDGTYEVGVDIAPGKYKTLGGDGGFCYWDRTAKNDGSLGDIKQQGVGDGPQTATVKAGEYFKTNNCGTWTKVG